MSKFLKSFNYCNGSSLVSVLVATVLISTSIAGFVSTLLINQAQRIQTAEQNAANHLVLELIDLISFIGSNSYPYHKFHIIRASSCKKQNAIPELTLTDNRNPPAEIIFTNGVSSSSIVTSIEQYTACKLWHIHPSTQLRFTGKHIEFTCSNSTTCVSIPFNNHV